MGIMFKSAIFLLVLFVMLPNSQALSVDYLEPAVNAVRYNYDFFVNEIGANNPEPFPLLIPLLGENDIYSGQMLVTQLHPLSQYFYLTNQSLIYPTGVNWPNTIALLDTCDSITGDLLETFIYEDYFPANQFSTPYAVGIARISQTDIGGNVRCESFKTVYDSVTQLPQVQQKGAFFTHDTPGAIYVTPNTPGSYIDIQQIWENPITRAFTITVTPLPEKYVSNVMVFEIPSFNVMPVVPPTSCSYVVGAPCSITISLPKQKVYHLETDDSAGVFTIDSFRT